MENEKKERRRRRWEKRRFKLERRVGERVTQNRKA